MKRWAYTTLVLVACAACGKSKAGTEFGNPPVVTPDLVSIERLTSDTVVVQGEAGAVTPGAGEVTVTNVTSGESVTTVVDEDGSFRAELPGTLDDEYEIVAHNANGSSATHPLTSIPPEMPETPETPETPQTPQTPTTPEEHDWHALHPCDDADPVDRAYVTATSVVGDTLTIDVLHGCGTHEFGLCYEVGFGASLPAVKQLQLLHDDHDDTCDALVTTTLTFDLTALQPGYARQFAEDSGLLRLAIGNCDTEPGAEALCGVSYAWGDVPPLLATARLDLEPGTANLMFVFPNALYYYYMTCSGAFEVLKSAGDAWVPLRDERPWTTNGPYYRDGEYQESVFANEGCDIVSCEPMQDQDIPLFEYVQTGTMPPPESDTRPDLPDEVPVIERRVPESDLRIEIEHHADDDCGDEPSSSEIGL